MADPSSVDLYVARAEADSLELYTGYPSNSGGFGARAGARLAGLGVQQVVDELAGAEPHVFSLIDLGGFVAEPYGQGCGARIGSSGQARLGETLDITLRADAFAPSGLFVSLHQDFALLGGGCTAQIGAVAGGFPATTDGAGEAKIPLPIPNQPSLVGVATYWQWASLSMGGPFSGAAKLSDGLEVVIGS